MGEFAEQIRTDEQLLAAHIAGDRFAFEELFHRYEAQLYRLARIITRCPDDARDALQEAMLSAHCNATGFRRDCTVKSWLHRILVNACLDRLRRYRARPTAPLDPYTARHAPDPIPRVDTAIVVEKALLRLPIDQRAAVVAVDMQGFSVAETAQLLGVPEGTIKSRCARGRAKLAAALKPLQAPVAR